jgi:protein-S-isoprenylcysteine O-methyltransferase Ste14
VPALVLAELIAAAVVFPVLLFVNAPYGRYLRAGWGPTLPARAGWMIMEAPAVVVPVVAYARAGGAWGGDGAWLLALWELHYVHRALVFPLRMRGAAATMRKPWLTVVMAVGFNVLNGWINGSALASWRADAWVVVGVLVFVVGLGINLHSDAVLRDLRAPGESGHKIPRGGLFRYVSAANYLGEIVEWLGFALAARTPASWAFAAFTAANLVPRAIAHHRWYRERFADYPRERRALIPGIL